MPINLRVLGSGAAVPSLKRGVTSHYLNFNERRILIDCGEGTQLQLRKYKIKFQRLQYIFISHLHGDHFLGVFGLISSMNLLGRTKKLIIFAPVGLEEIIRSQFKITGVYLAYELEFVTLNCTDKEVVFEDNLIEVFAFPLKHRIPCFGFLFQEKKKDKRINKDKIKKYSLSLEEILKAKRGFDIDREGEIISNKEVTHPDEKLLSYAFCTDTKYLPYLADWIKEASLLYHEATFTHDLKDRAKSTYHSTAQQAAQVAEAANVDRLILGHFSARYDNTDAIQEEASSVFPKVSCVNDGDVFLL